MILALEQGREPMNLNQLYNLQFVMFAELLCGYLLCRFRILKASDRGVLSKAVVWLFFPASIINAFQMELDAKVMAGFASILIVSVLIQLFCIIIAAFAFNHKDAARKPVLQFGTVCSNAGFLGNAVAEGLYGQEGLMFGQIYLIPLRIAMWSAGVSYFEKGNSLSEVIRKVLTHPCIIAVIIGLARMITGIQFPAALDSTLSSLGKCATPLIMVFLGMVTYDSGFKGLLNKDTLEYALIRLVLIPLAVLLAVKAARIEPLIASLSVILCAMPAGTTTALLAEQYGGDVHFAADCIVLTTLLSLAVLPVWAIICQAVL